MLQNGFIALHRSLLSWGWHTDPATGWLFVNLLLMANWTDSEWQGMTIERGQLVTGRKALAAQTGLSEQTVRTSLNRLKSTNEITIASTNKFSVITIVNYGKFQDVPEMPTSTLTSNLTNNQPAANQQLTTNEQEKQGEQGIKPRKRFTPPSVDEVAAYCRERGNVVDAQRFVDFYASKGWKVGNAGMRDWHAAVRNWERQDSTKNGGGKNGGYDGIACG